MASYANMRCTHQHYGMFTLNQKPLRTNVAFLGPNYGDGLLCPKGAHTPILWSIFHIYEKSKPLKSKFNISWDWYGYYEDSFEMVKVPMGLYIKKLNELFSIHYIEVLNTHCIYKASLDFSPFALVASLYEQTTCVHQIWLGFPTYFPNLQTMVLVHSMSHKNCGVHNMLPLLLLYLVLNWNAFESTIYSSLI